MAQKILVIDDDTDICLLLRRFLTKNGFKTFGYYRIAVGIILLVIHYFIHPLSTL